MHPTAFQNAASFNDVYLRSRNDEFTIVEIGSQDVNGSLRALWAADPRVRYVGVDFVAGKDVDVVLDDPYQLPFEVESADIVLSSSVFEHSALFWLLFTEIMRILKPAGLFYLNAPSNGDFHRWPVDCWRFYPDAGKALEEWGRRNGIPCLLLESYVSRQSTVDNWNDFVAVFLKDEAHLALYPSRILDAKGDVMNGRTNRDAGFINPSTMTEDLRKLDAIRQITINKLRVL